jgi:hypothetical protein
MGCYEISTEDGRPLVAQFSYATREFFFSRVPLPSFSSFVHEFRFALFVVPTYLMVFWRVFHDDCWGLGHACSCQHEAFFLKSRGLVETLGCVHVEIFLKPYSEGSDLWGACRGVLWRTRWQILRFHVMEGL